jgi:SAM-dependent methyltransferase
MIHLHPTKIATAILRNQTHRLKIAQVLNKALDRRERGGTTWLSRPVDQATDHVLDIFNSVRKYTGDLHGKIGLEIGPGDNLGVAYSFLKLGCAKMFAVERFDSIKLDSKAMVLLLQNIDARLEASEGASVDSETRADRVLRSDDGSYWLDPARLVLSNTLFEETCAAEELDFVYSNDVMEHVADPAAVFRAAYRVLKPGGLFINNIDLAGHNAFSNKARPLDFLTCSDWLWELMFSHIATTNRVRFSELVAAASSAGFRVNEIDTLVRAEPGYLGSLRSDMLPRYRALSDEDLSVVQCMMVVQK